MSLQATRAAEHRKGDCRRPGIQGHESLCDPLPVADRTLGRLVMTAVMPLIQRADGISHK